MTNHLEIVYTKGTNKQEREIKKMKRVFVKELEAFGEIIEEEKEEVLVRLNRDPWFPIWVKKEEIEIMPY